MIHQTFGVPTPFDLSVQDAVAAQRLEAAKAFRVLRDTGRINLTAELDFIVRLPGEKLLARYGHPGPWSVTLEPQVSVFDLDGGLLSGERSALAPVEEYREIFQRRSSLNLIARFNSPHLDAWARGGFDLPFIHVPLVRTSHRQGVKIYERGSTVDALESALDANFAGVTHLRGGSVIAGDQTIADVAALILRVEQAAQVELLSEVWTRSGRLERRRDEEKAPSWA